MYNYDYDPSYTGLPDDETALFNKMVAFKNKCFKKLKKVIREEQWLILCPNSGKSNSSDWDITMLVVVIRYATDLPPPAGGWDQKIANILDISKAGFCLLARQLRNDVKHGTMKSLSTLIQYNACRQRIQYILNGLCYSNMVLFEDLESGSLKLHTLQTVKLLEDRILDIEKNMIDKVVISDEMKHLKQALNNIGALVQQHDISEKHKKQVIRSIGVLVQQHNRNEKNQNERIGDLLARVSTLESNKEGM